MHPHPTDPEGCDAVILLTNSNYGGATTYRSPLPVIIIDGNDILAEHPKPLDSTLAHFIREYGNVMQP
jgi:hypothetical protein